MKLRRDTALALALIALLLAAVIPITLIMFAPSDREAIVAALTARGDDILASAQRYPELFPTLPGTAGADSTAPGPFTGLRFDRLGFFDQLTPDARSMFTDIGRFSLFVSPGAETFTLRAVGADDIAVVWENVGVDSIPEPRVE